MQNQFWKAMGADNSKDVVDNSPDAENNSQNTKDPIIALHNLSKVVKSKKGYV